jgi:hypothetical protein
MSASFMAGPCGPSSESNNATARMMPEALPQSKRPIRFRDDKKSGDEKAAAPVGNGGL